MLLSFAHKQAGCVILILVLLRYVVRFTAPRPAAIGAGIQKYTASLVHALLYAMMLLMPLTGMANLNAGNGVQFFGLRIDPTPIPFIDTWLENPGQTYGYLHYCLGWALSVSIGLHVLAVVWHQVVKRDNVLARMNVAG